MLHGLRPTARSSTLEQHGEPVTATVVASELCLACGLCCRGVLHPDAVLDTDEIAKADQLELTVGVNSAGYDVFALPCRHHDHAHNACTIYEERFHVCRRYTCDLLSLLLAGGITLEDAGGIAETTRAVESRVYAHLGGYDPTISIWRRISEHAAAREHDDPEAKQRLAAFLLDARLLSLLCHRHFEARLHKRLNATASASASRGDTEREST